MSNVISSLLVGIGFDYDKKSAQQIEGGIDSIKSKALQLGAVVAGGFGLKSLTADFASSADMLGKFGQTFGVNANEIQAFGNALATEGGSLESFMSQIESLERARARIRVGDVGFFAPAGKAGLDPNVIADANNATDAYLALADSFATMNTQERINAAEALGLDEASIRLLSQGRSAVEGLVSKYREIRPLTNQMTLDAAEFKKQWVEISANAGSFADAISSELLPVVNDMTKSINSWFSDDRIKKIEKIAGLTRAALGGGTPEENAESTGLPRWLFTTDLNETGEALGLPDWLTSPINELIRGSEGADSVIPSGTFIAPNPLGDVPQPMSDATMNVTPLMGNVPQPNDTTMNVTPLMGNVTQPNDATMNVTPLMGNVPQPSDATMNVTPLTGNVPQPNDTTMNVTSDIHVPNIQEMLQYSVPVEQNIDRNDAPQRSDSRVTQPTAPTSSQRTINLNATFEMDGRVLDRKIMTVVDGMAQTAIDDISSSTGG